MTITVCCVKTRPANNGKVVYDHQYVNIMQAMVARNLTIPHKFICVTDDDRGLKCATRHIPSGVLGWWGKLALFREGLFDPGTVIFFDLDTILIDNIDFMAAYDGNMAILRDFYHPDRGAPGVIIWRSGFGTSIWTEWIAQGMPIGGMGDLEWIERLDQGRFTRTLGRLQDLYPGKFVSFKEHCDSEVPSGAAVVCFHGEPKPHQLDLEHEVDFLLASQWRERLLTMGDFAECPA